MWTIIVCETCESHFASKEDSSLLSCPCCTSEELIETGEYLSETLYTASGKVIQK